MRHLLHVSLVALTLAVAAPGWAQTATELKKELRQMYAATK